MHALMATGGCLLCFCWCIGLQSWIRFWLLEQRRITSKVPHVSTLGKTTLYLVHVNAVRAMDIAALCKQRLHVIGEGCRTGHVGVAPHVQHVVGGPAPVATRNHVQEGDEVVAHLKQQ